MEMALERRSELEDSGGLVVPCNERHCPCHRVKPDAVPAQNAQGHKPGKLQPDAVFDMLIPNGNLTTLRKERCTPQGGTGQ